MANSPGKTTTGPSASQLELRTHFKLFLLQNPNYFGNLSKAGKESLKASMEIVSDVFYEQLTCISFNPQTSELSGIVQIKQTSGYSGGPCTDGSKEYVRFYVDYNNDGTWIDEGVVGFDAHDLPFSETLCYAVTLKLDPTKMSCCRDKPVLPRVRGILSWNHVPPADDPAWLPVWGNQLETNIQIAPRTGIFCNIIDVLNAQQIKIDPVKLQPLLPLLKDYVSSAKPVAAPLYALKESYGGKVADTRLGFKAMYALSKKANDTELVNHAQALKLAGLDIQKILEFLLKPQFDTAYEEIKCVGLDRDRSMLHGSVQVKNPSGYGGGLCYSGSREFVAFYLDFGSGWEYMGTSSVAVHDIPEMPAGGLSYAVMLPVSLTAHQLKWCETGKAKIRAILSWDVAPTPNDPEYKAHWGDWEECNIEIRPLPAGVQPGQVVPVIESLGGMPVDMINVLGYANGTNSAALHAIDSPFDGQIVVTGIIANAPNRTSASDPMARYRLMVKKPSASAFQPWLGHFTVDITTIVGGIVSPQVHTTLTPDADGWVNYQPDFAEPYLVTVDQNILGVFQPSEEGLHELYVEVAGVANPSNHVKFMVDRTHPDVDIEITTGTGNCGKFPQGEVIEGTFSISDAHCLDMVLSVTPTGPAHGATPELVLVTQAGSSTSVTMPSGISSLSYTAVVNPLDTLGAHGTWKLNTSSMDPCGYNVRIRGRDRTIVNSRWLSHEWWDIKGFCIKE